jgi:hypothetical protein
MDAFDEYLHTKVMELKQLTGATNVVADLTGVTLTIEGKPLFVHHRAIRTMMTLVNRCEEVAMDKLRAERDAERKQDDGLTGF